jgi:hypothetical protein
MRMTRTILIIAAASALAGSFTLNSVASDFKALTKVGVESPSAADCGKCHIDIYHEWQASPHAQSYVSDSYRKATREHDFDKCTGCHAPSTVFAEGTPTTRPQRPEEGVTCITCHLRDGAMAGPVESTALVHPHPISVDVAFYNSSELCGKCHVGTVEEATANGATNSCQECHMPRIVRKSTQAKGGFARLLVAFEDKVPSRKHGFSLHAMSAPAGSVPISLAIEPGTNGQSHVVATITHALPHSIPTGDYGFRRATLAINARDNKGVSVASRKVDFFKELDTALQPGKDYRFEMPLAENTALIEAQLFRTGRDGQNRVEITQASLKLPGTPTATKATD